MIKLQICLIVIFIYDSFKVSKCFEHYNSIRLLCYRCETAVELLNYRFWKDYNLVSTFVSFYILRMNTDAALRLHKLRFELTRASARDARLSRRKIPIIPREFLSIAVHFRLANAIFCFGILPFFFLASATLTAFLDRGKIKYRRRRGAFSTAARMESWPVFL